MTELVQVMMPYIPSSAIPVVIVVLGCCYLWNKTRTKFMALENERVENKKVRDKELQDLCDLCKENSLEIKHLKEDLSQKNEILDTLRSQVNELNVNLAIVSERIVTLVDVIKELKK